MKNGNQEHEDQDTSHVIRHYCRVCNKGFGCAGALGGHMRSHVMGGDACHNVDGNMNTIKPEGNKHSYFLRAKMPRFMGYQVSSSDNDNGQEYKKLSSASKYYTDKERMPSFLSSPFASSASGFASKHESLTTSREEEDLANCLVMLSNKSCHNNKEENKAKEVVQKGLFECKACKKAFTSHQALGGHRASHKKVKGCFAAKTDDHGLHDEDNVDEVSIQEDQDHVATPEPNTTRSTSMKKRPNKVHECSVCRRVFSSGQALGGHKRCHWRTTSRDNAFIPNFHDFQNGHQNQLQKQQQQQKLQQQQCYKKPMLTTNPNQQDHCDNNQIDLNLNLHAPLHENTNRYQTTSTLYLQQLTTNAGKLKNENDERGCEVKLRKLSELRDVNLDGGWLQMGLASTTDIC